MYARLFAWTALAALLIGLAGACGGEDEELDPDEPRKTATADDFSTYEVASQRFSIAVPSSWEALSVEKVFDEDEAEMFAEENPQFAEVFRAISRPNSPVKFFAADPEVVDEFATNVNVVVIRAPRGATFADLVRVDRAQLRQIAKGPVDDRIVTLPAGRAHRMAYEAEFVHQGEARRFALLQYALLARGASYTLSYTTFENLKDKYAAAFEQSARSFRLT